ncbi:MAG TPA: phosphatase [Parvularcula sp.]|nr:phosphatase [Parvularcula sp.]
MTLSRRSLVMGASAAVAGFAGLRALGLKGALALPTVSPHGALLPDPNGLLDLPAGFAYDIVSREGVPMADGFLTPGAFDGMACFPAGGDGTRVALVRNHEIWPDMYERSAYGPDLALAARLPKDKVFDFTPDGRPKFGGTTTLVYDLKAKRIVRDHLSLAGTTANCCGGPTPWGSWLTCEETIEKPGPHVTKEHGWVFEVPARAAGLADPLPLKAMGRFIHEAAAVDPKTGVVYMTEDRQDGLFYRFLPDRKTKLARGGRLQALALKDGRERDFRNWPKDGDANFPGAGPVIASGAPAEAVWIDLDGVDSPNGDLKERGFAKGALRFARGEGLAVGAGADGRTEIYISCTSGGPIRLGQVFRYRPSTEEGRPGEKDAPGTLELFIETDDDSLLKNCDNAAFAPWGDVILCEDGYDYQAQYLRGVTPEGALYTIAGNVKSEFCGACFSPDGKVLFVNIQKPGVTFAIRGPWRSARG